RVGGRERTMSADDFELARDAVPLRPSLTPPPAPVAPIPTPAPAVAAAPAPAPVAPPPPVVPKGIEPDDFIETLNVLVSIIENGRAELRGHSSQVARLTRQLGERIGLDEAEFNAILIAAYLHD